MRRCVLCGEPEDSFDLRPCPVGETHVAPVPEDPDYDPHDPDPYPFWKEDLER